MELFYVPLILLFVSRGLGALAHKAGQPRIVGALFAGLYLTPPTAIEHRHHDELRKKVQGLTAGFLAPLFFVSSGLCSSSHR